MKIVLVAGRVQNVWYRGWLRETAERHGVRRAIAGTGASRRSSRGRRRQSAPMPAMRGRPRPASTSSDAEPPDGDGFLILPTA